MDEFAFGKLSRRQLLQGGASAAAAFAAIGPDKALAARELRFMLPGGTWKEFMDKTFIEPFAKANNVEIVYKLGIAMEPIVMAQQRRPQWDLIHCNQTKAEQLGSMNLYRTWTQDKLPNLAKIHPSFRYEHLVGKTHTPYGLCVNTKEIKREINSWNDMWDPAFKGKVAFPAWNWVGDEVFQAINLAFGGTSDNIDIGIAKFKTLFKDNDCQIINNVEQTLPLLKSGDVWLCPHFGARVGQAAAAGAPVEFVIPKEGGLSWIWNTALINNRPQDETDLAYKYLDTTLETEGQLAFARLTGYPPTNIEAMKNLPPDLKKLYYSDSDLELLGKLQRQVDFMTQFAYRDQYLDRWNKEVLAAK